jgi:hypothetical protein
MAESAPRKLSYQEILEEALRAREQFLKEHPHLQAFQDEIDRMLEKTVGFENRMSVLAFMIETKLYELKESIAQLYADPLEGEEVFNKAKFERGDKVPDCSTISGCYFN